MPTPLPPRAPAPSRRAWWIFHAVLAVVTAVALFAFSPPGFHFELLALVVLGFLGLGIAWLALLADTFHARGRPWRLSVAPVVVIALLAALFVQAPRRVRWALSRPAFEDLVAALPTPVATAVPEWSGWSERRDVGTYTITAAMSVTGGYVFYESNGSFFDDAGLAHLPYGPGDHLVGDGFDPEKFWSLGGAWYAWTDQW